MDAHRFDALTRSLGAGASRRGLGRILGGLALSGGIAAHGSERADAKKKRKHKKKKNKKKDCSKHCSAGLCCDGECVSVLTDRHNCGACAEACPADKSCICTEKETCLNGKCEPCADPRKICKVSGEERCVDLQTDRNNCGFCGNICPKSPSNPLRDFVCQGGECVCTGTVCANGRCCPAGFRVCVEGGAGCCPDNYHSCGNDRCCPDGYTCGGTCGQECCAV
jgi:hypothetical protein